MKKIGVLTLIMLFSLSAASAQKKDRTDAYMYNKVGQYEKAMCSIEKCVNHSDFYRMKIQDQATAWLYRALIYYNVSTMSNAATICPNALAISAESLQKCKQTDYEVANENKEFIQSLENYLNAYSSTYTTTQNTSSSYTGNTGQNSQWDFYESIPNFKSISFEIKGDDVWSGYSLYSNGNYSSGSTGSGRLSLTIYDDYTVSLGFTSVMRFDQDNYRDSNIPVRIIGNGMIVWRNERMEMSLQVTESTTGGNDNVRSTVSTRTGEQTVHSSFSMPSYSNSQTYSYVLEYVGRR